QIAVVEREHGQPEAAGQVPRDLLDVAGMPRGDVGRERVDDVGDPHRSTSEVRARYTRAATAATTATRMRLVRANATSPPVRPCQDMCAAWQASAAGDPAARQAMSTFAPRPPSIDRAKRYRLNTVCKIGRASCRERGKTWAGAGAER